MTDISIHNHGSIVLLQGVSDAGQDWIDENLMHDEIITWCGQLAVEPRYVDNIIDGAINDGLTVN